jgi:nucleoside-diphosphate-sugar epimerase
MRVHVAGATGAKGKQLVPRLVAAGHEVHGMTGVRTTDPIHHAPPGDKELAVAL